MVEQEREETIELVVQRGPRGENAPQAQMRRARSDGWTGERRALFLDVLRSTCNVSEALRVVGMSDSSLYNLRKRDPAFATAWQDALDHAYDRLEWLLLMRTSFGDERIETVRTGDGQEATVKGTKTITSYSAAMAWKTLVAHRNSVERHRAQRAAVTGEEEATRVRLLSELAAAEAKLIRVEGRQQRRAEAALQRRAAKQQAKSGVASA
ncbi:MAG: hypothetical protein ACSLE1_13520 [Sphingobium sp.]